MPAHSLRFPGARKAVPPPTQLSPDGRPVGRGQSIASIVTLELPFPLLHYCTPQVGSVWNCTVLDTTPFLQCTTRAHHRYWRTTISAPSAACCPIPRSVLLPRPTCVPPQHNQLISQALGQYAITDFAACQALPAGELQQILAASSLWAALSSRPFWAIMHGGA